MVPIDVPDEQAGRYPDRVRRAPKDLNDYVCSNIDFCCTVRSIPNTYSEAIQSPESVRWINAMDDEMASLRENDTYTSEF